MAAADSIDFAALLPDVAERLLGQSNNALSSKAELRYGTHGSLSVKIAGPHAGTWRDHESGTGGGVLDLIVHYGAARDRAGALDWIRQEFPETAREAAQRGKREIVATYDYTGEAGELLFQVVRLTPKEFRQRRPDGKGGWAWNLKDVQRVPYRLPELIEDIALGRPVFIVEGEKSADRLRAINVPATCFPGGAGKWRADYAEWFRGAHVIVLPDNDDPGRLHGEAVARGLYTAAARVKLLPLPELPRKGDVVDWLDSGGTVEALNALAEAAAEHRPDIKTRLPFIWFGEEDKQPPLSWLVKGALPNGGFSVIYGAPGSSKSFLTLDLALSIAHGRDWFGHRVTAGPVLYVAGEGASGMLQRMKAWRQERAGDPAMPFALIPRQLNLFDDDDDTDMLLADIAQQAQRLGEPVRLIVFDTLSRMIGTGDEDRAAEVSQVVQRCARLQTETGAHVLIVHHSGKDQARGMRGSNALLAAADATVEVKQFDSGLCEAKFTKVKDGAGIEAIRYELRQSVLGQDEDGEDIASCVIEATDASQGIGTAKRPRLTDTERIALDALKEAIREGGEASPGGHVPVTVRVTSVTHWRRYADARGLTDSDIPNTKRQAFLRIRSRLQSKGFIGLWNDTVWIVQEPDNA